MARIKKLYRAQRQHRYVTLRDENFTKAEAMALSHFKFKQPYIRQMRIDRRALARKVSKLGLSRQEALAELLWNVKKIYDINGWKDAYAMMRWYRAISLEKGDYIATAKKKRPRLDKGNVKAQGERWRARQAVKERDKREGRFGVQYDSAGNRIGYVEFNETTGRFEAVYD